VFAIGVIDNGAESQVFENGKCGCSWCIQLNVNPTNVRCPSITMGVDYASNVVYFFIIA
jgi:hypothetical protein